MLRVTEELLLLIVDAESGGIQHSLPAHQQDALIAGAVLTDLALENRIDTDAERLFLVDDEMGFMTGSTLSINGGQHMY